jgi:hypothetical protein
MTLKEVLSTPTIYVILMMMINLTHAPHGVGAFYIVCLLKYNTTYIISKII